MPTRLRYRSMRKGASATTSGATTNMANMALIAAS